MTKQEAKKRLGLSENDTISEDGVKSLIESTEKLLDVWSIGKRDRENLEKDLDAYRALLRKEETMTERELERILAEESDPKAVDKAVRDFIESRKEVGAMKYPAQEKYDAQNTTQIKLKLNLKTDADILEQLAKVGNKQGYIKELIRKDMRGE